MASDDQESVLRSIAEGNHKRLKKLLGRKAGLKNFEDLCTPLLEACRLGREDCVSSLLAAKADPNTTDDEGKTPLFLLLEKGGANPAIVRMLLQAGSSPNKVTWQMQQTALHVAARKGFQVCIKDLVATGARVDKADSSGNTPLMYAAREGHVSVIRSLIREGADVNMRNLAKECALHFAARNGHAECVAQLLQHKASANLRDMRGQTPMLLACKHPHIPAIEVLLSHCVDVNVQDTQNGKTPLHYAIQHGDAGLVAAILDSGAEPNVRDKNWQTPFMLALSMSRRDIMELLLHARCDVAVTDKNFNTALHFAARDGQTDLITLLIEAGICVDIKGAGGLTPLMWAAYGGYVSIVGLLLKYGATPDLMDRNLATALMYAIISTAPDSSCNEIVKVLIRANSNLNQSANLQNVVKHMGITIGDGIELQYRLYSPVEVAFIKGRSAVFLMLIRAGCDITDFHCEHVHLMDQFKSLSPYFRDRWYLLRCFKKEKERVKGLKELCRGPALEYMKRLPGYGIQTHISRLDCSDHIKGFLNFADLEDVESNVDDILRERESPRRSRLRRFFGSRDLSNIGDAKSVCQNGSENLAFSRSDSKRQSLPTGYATVRRYSVDVQRSSFRSSQQSTYRRSEPSSMGGRQSARMTLSPDRPHSSSEGRSPSKHSIVSEGSSVRRSLDFDRPPSRQGSPPSKPRRADRPASLRSGFIYSHRQSSTQSLNTDLRSPKSLSPDSPREVRYLQIPSPSRDRLSSRDSSSVGSPPPNSPRSRHGRVTPRSSTSSHHGRTTPDPTPTWQSGFSNGLTYSVKGRSDKHPSAHGQQLAWEDSTRLYPRPKRPLQRYNSLQDDVFVEEIHSDYNRHAGINGVSSRSSSSRDVSICKSSPAMKAKSHHSPEIIVSADMGSDIYRYGPVGSVAKTGHSRTQEVEVEVQMPARKLQMEIPDPRTDSDGIDSLPSSQLNPLDDGPPPLLSVSLDEELPPPIKRSDPKRQSLPVGFYSRMTPKSYKHLTKGVTPTTGLGKGKEEQVVNGHKQGKQVSAPDGRSSLKRTDPKRQSLPAGYCTIRKHNIQNGVKHNGHTHAHSGQSYERAQSPSKSILRHGSSSTELSPVDTSPDSSVDMNYYLYGSSGSLDTRRSDTGVVSPRDFHKKGVRFSLGFIKEDLLEDLDLKAERKRFSTSRSSSNED